MNSINKSLQYHFNHCLIYSNILIFSCLFPLCLVKFRDVCVFRKLTTVFFVLLPAIVFFISESLLSYWAFIHVAARVHTRSWCHIPADLSLKPFSSANFLWDGPAFAQLSSMREHHLVEKESRASSRLDWKDQTFNLFSLIFGSL